MFNKHGKMFNLVFLFNNFSRGRNDVPVFLSEINVFIRQKVILITIVIIIIFYLRFVELNRFFKRTGRPNALHSAVCLDERVYFTFTKVSITRLIRNFVRRLTIFRTFVFVDVIIITRAKLTVFSNG